MLLGLVSGALWFGLFVLCQALLFHWALVRNRSQAMMWLLAIGLAGHVATVAVASAANVGAPLAGGTLWLLSGFAGLVLMVSCFLLYAPLYYTFAASQSLQALILIVQAPDYRRPLEDVIADATSDSMLRQRLDSMVASGNLSYDGVRYQPSVKGHLIAAVFSAVQRLWRLDPVG